jgi:PAS domain S-box-containing protein
VSTKSTFIPAELLYEAIVNSSEDAIASKDLQSIVKSWNNGAERVFGYSADETVGQSIVKLIPPDRQDEEAKILARLQRGEQVEHFETKRRRKNGKIIDVSLTISPIRNAEGIIVGASKIAEGIPVIERNVRMQSQMIEDLLDMGRIESGKVSLDVQRVDLEAVVGAGIETVRPAATAKEIRLTSAFSDVSGIVMGDKDRLQQVVWNLLANAVKFTPKNGRIHVVVKRANSHVEIEVIDSSQGIAPEFLGEVFDRFRQADATTTRRHGGLGLGLAIVKHLAELHGGTVRVVSEGEGQGATFTVCLPLQPLRHESPDAAAQAQRNAAIDDAASKIELEGIKVLVVDDDEDSVSTVRRILERHGAEVCGAYSMEEALKEFPRFAPHVVVSDIGMPGHDGYELIARLRAMPGGRTVPAIALTALAPE